jgi:seryl-tRNA synthetase
LFNDQSTGLYIKLSSLYLVHIDKKGSKSNQVELLSELEVKIDKVLLTVKTVKEEKDRITQESEERKQKIQELETTNQSLKNDVESLQKSIEEKQNKLDNAAEKIQGLLTKLESAA